MRAILTDHISVTIERQFNDCCEIKYLNDLTDPDTELFQGKPGETDYVKAICKLKNVLVQHVSDRQRLLRKAQRWLMRSSTLDKYLSQQ